MKRLFITLLLLGFSGIFSQDQSGELRKNVKNVKLMIEGLEIYDQVEKKRLYGAISQKGAIEFKLQSSPMEAPTSVAIGIATDGTIQEMLIRVYITNDLNEKIKKIREDNVVGEKDWVFEIIDSSKNYLVDIQVKKSRRNVALVEVIHGFYYGHQSNEAFSSSTKKTGNPSSDAPKQDGDSLSPIDVYNRFDMFKKALWE